MAYRGSWDSGTAYAVGDTVDHRFESFTCTVAHTSDADHEPDSGASWDDKWDRVGSADSAFTESYGTTAADATQGELDTHATDTTSVHGITDTANLETVAGAT